MINRPDHAKWLSSSNGGGFPRHEHSMSRERSAKDRERQKQLAREMRESQAASAVPMQDRETQPVVFDVVRRSPNTKVFNNDVERVLGKYDTFTKVGGNRINMVGVEQQPPTPAPARQPIHDPDNYPSPPPPPSGPGPGSNSKPRSLPPPQSTHNGSTRPPKSMPSSIKPPLPPSHHALAKNGEVKGSLKSGPGPGPGGGGGGGRNSGSSGLHKPQSHLQVDTTIQLIMSEMSVRNPVSAIIKTPRHDSTFHYPPLTPLKDTPVKESSSSSNKESSSGSLSRSRKEHVDLPQKLGNTAELSRQRQPKPPNGSNIDDDLGLSEDSEEDEERERPITDVRLAGVGHGGTPVGQLPSSNSKPPLSPISSPKTSEESSTSDESSDDSDVSSNNTSDERPDSPPASPKPQEDKSWKLGNFIPQRKTNSPISQGTAAPGPMPGQPDDGRSLAITSPAPVKGKRERHPVKATVTSSSSHRGPRSAPDLRAQSKSESNGHYSDSSGEVESQSHHRPTLRVPALQPHSKSKASLSRMRIPSGPQLSSDSEDEPDSFHTWKGGSAQSLNGSNASGKGVSKVPEKPAKTIVPPTSRETNRKNSRKNPDSKKDYQAAKSESGKSKRANKSREYIQTDSDDSIIDVVTTTPEKVPRGTPTSSIRTPPRTPKDFPKGNPSPVKSVQASPQVSPMTSVSVSSKNSAKRSSSARLGESQSSESLVNKSDDDVQSHTGRSQGGSQKLDQTRDKEGVVNRFSTLAKKEKAGREKDPADRKAKSCDTKKSSGGMKERADRSKTDRSRTISDTSSTDSRNEGRPGASPMVSNKICESPIVSAEPKVPIPQIQYENGVAKLTCTIPLSFIDKVPKHSENSVSGISKTDIKQEIDTKDVLDNRTREGKGKRKACDPSTKASCNEDKSKSKILTSIFKVKKEIKTEPVDSDEEDTEKNDMKISHRVKVEPEEGAMARPGSVRQRYVSASPMSSVASDSSTSRQHRKKKKKDKQPDKSPPSRDRKRARSNSERIPSEHSNVPAADSSSCDVRRSRRDSTSVESERSTNTRKREHERDSSLESTKSSSRSTSESTEKRSKKARLAKEANDVADVPMSSPNTRSGSQQATENSQHAWQQEEDTPQSKYTQRSKHSQHSSQKDYKSVPEDSGRNQGAEFGEEETEATQTTQLAFSGKEKTEVNGTTANTESSGYQSRPTSEHESSATTTVYRSVADQTGTTQAGTTDSTTSAAPLESNAPMVPPGTHRQTVSGTVVASGSVHSSSGPGRPAVDQDYTCYLNKAKELKHIADGEADRSMQAMKYLEAALYFILSGMAMEKDHDTTAPLTMYKDTLNFIKWVSSVFRRENQEGTINLKLAVISLRCQSLLSLKIYMMRRNEHKENQRQLNRYFQQNAPRPGGVDGHGNNTSGSNTNWGGQRATGSPSHLSQTPSPAGSVGSEGSQSSGYTTSTEGARQKSGAAPVGHTPPHPQPPHGPIQTVPVPFHIHALFFKQNQLSGHLASAHDMWIEADHYVYMHGMEEFFIDLDRNAGPLTLHSSLDELMNYVMYGLDRLRG